ncbi:hypothetical protein HPP92_011197 [Vanilla planifolia]|uniref:O-fucosyltransferase family protein n=1 Tax=Vanilla planifolia TaxID=51239 RepID=A0A835UY81_VANPL|nr:hypothetical protein HPP92_011197 [Vanilla planifolia]
MKRQKLTPGSLAAMRQWLTCAIAVIGLCSLTAVHLLSLCRVAILPDAFKLLKPENGFRSWSGELKWMEEVAPPQLSKMRFYSTKVNQLDFVNDSLEFKQLWKAPSSRDFVQCVEPYSSYSAPRESRGYLIVHTNGGLNQMRAGNFADVFDEGHFIKALANDVHIVKKLPKEMKKESKVLKHFISWSSIEYYQEDISRLWDKYKVIHAAKSDSRLANNNLPTEIQKLRCRAFFEALRFAPQIESLGKLLIERMRSNGRYIALHLRYEKDMLAFTGCTYGLSSAEADELEKIRENTSYWRVKNINSQEQRTRGYCPLTPKEVGIFLSALGYPSNTPIYIASGEIYGGNSQMFELKSRFPLLMTKETLASAAELEPFIHHASQLAALDYIVSVASDVFVPSYSGNMARAVAGHRRFLGHRKTISPDRKALVRLFDKINEGTLIEDKSFFNMVMEIHRRRFGSPRKRKGPISGTKGKERFRSEESFYENPLPDCLCRKGSVTM